MATGTQTRKSLMLVLTIVTILSYQAQSCLLPDIFHSSSYLRDNGISTPTLITALKFVHSTAGSGIRTSARTRAKHTNTHHGPLINSATTAVKLKQECAIGFRHTRFSAGKRLKHGYISLSIQGHDPPQDITGFNDIPKNPVPTSKDTCSCQTWRLDSTCASPLKQDTQLEGSSKYRYTYTAPLCRGV